MLKNAPPSIDPADNDTLAGAFKHVLRKHLQRNIDDMLPCIVQAVDRAKNIVTVQPLIMVTTTLGEQISRAPVTNIPILQLGGGGFVLNFPIKNGDLGWIKANDRDISLFVQSFTEAKPNTNRLHSFSDGLFVPNILTGFSIDGDDADNVVLQTLDGSVKISMGENKITINAPEIEINSNITLNGGIVATGDIVSGDISLQTHIHSGVQGGSGNTGGPVG